MDSIIVQYTVIFISLMAFWWLVAEGVLIVITHWAWRYAGLGHSPGFHWKANYIVAFFILAGAGLLLARYYHPYFSPPVQDVMIFRRLTVWNALCTLWVGFEAALVLYLSRLVDVLEGRTVKRGIGILVFVIAAIFAIYHFPLSNLVGRGALPMAGLENVLRFYVRICGVFWVAIEFLGAYRVFHARRLILARL